MDKLTYPLTFCEHDSHDLWTGDSLPYTYAKCSWNLAHCRRTGASINTAHGATAVGVVMESLNVSGRWRSSGESCRSVRDTTICDLCSLERILLRIYQKARQKTPARVHRWWFKLRGLTQTCHGRIHRYSHASRGFQKSKMYHHPKRWLGINVWTLKRWWKLFLKVFHWAPFEKW